ncbi:hypothetical protein LCGC14_1466060 [marine sediment metagenome]|uniref:HD/PDEase domain-containing protein n=1 Tax=marine sediment metagenome TaxID=412755 RepID=A0A0F9JZQ2_9ZZZZ
MNFVEKAERIAREAHKRQKRWNGEPYIIHPEAVAEAMRIRIKESFLDDYMATAWLHDVIEDCNITVINLLEKNIPENVALAVLTLTKRKNESYLDYILRIRMKELSRLVKIEDIFHNMYSIPKDGSELNKTRLQRYELAKYMLEN